MRRLRWVCIDCAGWVRGVQLAVISQQFGVKTGCRGCAGALKSIDFLQKAFELCAFSMNYVNLWLGFRVVLVRNDEKRLKSDKKL